jgi:mono/diheme cytochrome c family protein
VHRVRQVSSAFIRRWSAALATSLAMALPGAPAVASDVVQGRAIAERNCAGCHAIAGPGPSPAAPAPPFSSLARKWPIEYPR